MRLNPELFLLGLDYPVQTWRRFDHQSFERLATIASDTGLQAIRLRLPWAEFQPDGGRCSDSCLRDLESVMNTCGALHIGLMPVAFSSLDFAPGFPTWASQGPETAVEVQLRLLETLSGYFRAHRALLAWELDSKGVLTPAVGSAWLSELLPALRSWDDRHSVALGLDEERFSEEDGNPIQSILSSADLAVMRASGDLERAGRAASVIMSFSSKPVFLVTGTMPGSGAHGLDGLSALPAEGVGGLFVALPESSDQPDTQAWLILKQAVSAAWRVHVPPDIVPEPGDRS